MPAPASKEHSSEVLSTGEPSTEPSPTEEPSEKEKKGKTKTEQQKKSSKGKGDAGKYFYTGPTQSLFRKSSTTWQPDPKFKDEKNREANLALYKKVAKHDAEFNDPDKSSRDYMRKCVKFAMVKKIMTSAVKPADLWNECKCRSIDPENAITRATYKIDKAKGEISTDKEGRMELGCKFADYDWAKNQFSLKVEDPRGASKPKKRKQQRSTASTKLAGNNAPHSGIQVNSDAGETDDDDYHENDKDGKDVDDEEDDGEQFEGPSPAPDIDHAQHGWPIFDRAAIGARPAKVAPWLWDTAIGAFQAASDIRQWIQRIEMIREESWSKDQNWPEDASTILRDLSEAHRVIWTRVQQDVRHDPEGVPGSSPSFSSVRDKQLAGEGQSAAHGFLRNDWTDLYFRGTWKDIHLPNWTKLDPPTWEDFRAFVREPLRGIQIPELLRDDVQASHLNDDERVKLWKEHCKGSSTFYGCNGFQSGILASELVRRRLFIDPEINNDHAAAREATLMLLNYEIEGAARRFGGTILKDVEARVHDLRSNFHEDDGGLQGNVSDEGFARPHAPTSRKRPRSEYEADRAERPRHQERYKRQRRHSSSSSSSDSSSGSSDRSEIHQDIQSMLRDTYVIQNRNIRGVSRAYWRPENVAKRGYPDGLEYRRMTGSPSRPGHKRVKVPFSKEEIDVIYPNAPWRPRHERRRPKHSFHTLLKHALDKKLDRKDWTFSREGSVASEHSGGGVEDQGEPVNPADFVNEFEEDGEDDEINPADFVDEAEEGDEDDEVDHADQEDAGDSDVDDEDVLKIDDQENTADSPMHDVEDLDDVSEAS